MFCQSGTEPSEIAKGRSLCPQGSAGRRWQKDNRQLAPLGDNAWDRADPRNAGVLADELVATSQGVSVRRVRYHCVVRGEEFSFLTSEYTLPPGVIAHLYRLRWEIEKTFDELKNKLGETKAWASSAKAQALPAHFLCLAHNLMILCEAELARVHGGRNAAELTRRAPRLEPEEKRLAKENLVRLRLVRTLQRCTVRSVKFIRWLPGATLSPASPRAGQRRPAPVLCGFVGGFSDTVG